MPLIKSKIVRHYREDGEAARQNQPMRRVDNGHAKTYATVMSPVYLRVKELRLALGLTQRELAARAGIRRATVSRIENRQVTAIDFRVLEKLADVLGVDPGFLVTRAPVLPRRSGKENTSPARPGRRPRE